ncbi:MAG: hypothetical protein QM755_08900 [Luteolibacter sp.]
MAVLLLNRPATSSAAGKQPPAAAAVPRGAQEGESETVEPGAYFPEPPGDKGWSKPLKSSLQAIFHERSEANRDKLLQQAAAAIAPGDFAEVLGYLREFDREDLSANLTADLANRLMERWTTEDLKGFADWTAKTPPGTFRDDAINYVIEGTAATNVGAAESWARSLADPDARNLAIRNLAQQQTVNHPEEALRLLKDVPPDPDQPGADPQVTMAASNWAHDHLEDATRWVSQLQDSPMKTEALAGIAISMAEKDPAGAAAFAVDEMPVCQRQSDTVVGVVQLWAQQDPDKAADWVGQFPTGPMKDSASRTLVAIWSQTAPDKAKIWMKQQVGQ